MFLLNQVLQALPLFLACLYGATHIVVVDQQQLADIELHESRHDEGEEGQPRHVGGHP